MHLNYKAVIATLTMGSAFLSHSSSFADATMTRKLLRASIEEDAVPDKWIVTLKKETNVNATNSSNYQKNLKGEFVQTKEQLRGLASAYRGNLDRVFHNAIYGMEVTMGEDDAIKMAANPSVAYVEQVSVVRFIQQSPATWGIDRIDQRNLPLDNTYNPGTADGTGITAYVIDTGVQITHDEFKNASGQSRASWGINTSGDNEDQDCHGHGTHVAGTVGGLQYGVAKNVNIVAVKVLQCSGSGSTAGVVAGVEWAMNHAASNNISNKAVANMSLGGGFSSASNTAVRNLHNSGVLTAVAAGNDNANACNYSPASEPTVITVGSTTSTDSRSSFSNYGSCLDIFAPGSSITAAWIGSNSATRTISGTSMASPHVAGGLAVKISGGSIDAESDVINNATPGKVTNPQSNSPNLLLYISGINVPNPTSRNPTSRNPTSRNPTSRNPTSRNPTSRNPTSRNPTSRNPTSRNPTTKSPSTKSPSSKPSSGPCKDKNKDKFFYKLDKEGKPIKKNCKWLKKKNPSKILKICKKNTDTYKKFGPPKDVCKEACGRC